jgi:hypothetical protein
LDMLGFKDKDAVGILVAKRMLSALGNPPRGAPNWFATVTILDLANDAKWLDKASRIVREHVRAKNQEVKVKNGTE